MPLTASDFLKAYRIQGVLNALDAAGTPTVSGVIRDAAGDFASRQVYAYDRATGALVGSDISDGVTGAYSIGVNSTNTFVVALDDNTLPDLNAIIVDRIVPV